MNCDCINDIEKRLADYMKPEAGADATATCMATGFELGTTLRLVVNIPFRIRGSMKGFTSLKGKEMPVTASYCPFCARDTRRYEVGQDDGIEAAMRGAV